MAAPPPSAGAVVGARGKGTPSGSMQGPRARIRAPGAELRNKGRKSRYDGSAVGFVVAVILHYFFKSWRQMVNDEKQDFISVGRLGFLATASSPLSVALGMCVWRDVCVCVS